MEFRLVKERGIQKLSQMVHMDVKCWRFDLIENAFRSDCGSKREVVPGLAARILEILMFRKHSP